MGQPLRPFSLYRALQELSQSLSAAHRERKLVERLSENNVNLRGKSALVTYSMCHPFSPRAFRLCSPGHPYYQRARHQLQHFMLN